MSQLTTASSPAALEPDEARVDLNRLFIAGLLFRIAVFFLASPFNFDRHYEVIQYIAAHYALPASNVLQQSYHPPLYYLLMTPIALMTNAVWPIHLFSLILSCANLLLVRRAMNDSTIIAIAPRASIRIVGFALLALLPQLIMFGSFISNDPLTQLFGTLQCLATLAFIRQPTFRRVVILGLLVALGLLTKGTFLLTVVPVALLIGHVTLREVGRAQALRWMAAFAAISLALGSYKFAENYVRLGRPIVHNQEMGFVSPYPRTMWHGPATLYGFDLPGLLRRPVILPSEPGSYTRMLYATFWYSYLADSSFRGSFSGYDSVGRAIYLLAIVPTLVFLVGIGVAFQRLFRVMRERRSSVEDLMMCATLGLFLANLAVVVAAGVKFNVWECFQARLCFQAALPMLLLFLAGAHSMLNRARLFRRSVIAVCGALVGCFALYFCVEFALIVHVLDVDESRIFEIYHLLPGG